VPQPHSILPRPTSPSSVGLLESYLETSLSGARRLRLETRGLAHVSHLEGRAQPIRVHQPCSLTALPELASSSHLTTMFEDQANQRPLLPTGNPLKSAIRPHGSHGRNGSASYEINHPNHIRPRFVSSPSDFLRLTKPAAVGTLMPIVGGPTCFQPSSVGAGYHTTTQALLGLLNLRSVLSEW